MTHEKPKGPPPVEPLEDLEWLWDQTAAFHSDREELDVARSLLASTVERVNAAFGALMIPEQAIDLTFASRVLADPYAPTVYEGIRAHLLNVMRKRAGPVLAQKTLRVNGGVEKPCQILAVPIVRQNGDVAGFMVFLRTAERQEFARRQLALARHVALQFGASLDRRYDAGTGLLTRGALEEEAERIAGRFSSDRPHAALYFDIDSLHIVNESFGFDAGDEVIASVAQVLHAALAQGGLASRIAGDRFAVFLPQCPIDQARQWAQSVQQDIGKIRVGPGSHSVTLSLSCGIAALPRATVPFTRALAAAELACRTAKERGRNRIEEYQDLDDSMMRRRSDILSAMRLRAALEKDRLQIYAQKVVSLRNLSELSGFECLVRLVAEDGEIISPQGFMSAAQRYQMMKAVDEWVIRHTLEILRPHASMLYHAGLYAAINLSGQSLNDEAFLHSLENWIASSGVAPGLIMFEITETAAVAQLPRTDQFIRRLRRMGCRFALDDFGTGTNSLAYLQKLSVDRVKLDGTFVRDVVTNPSSEALIRAVLQLAKSHNIDCVAEFVESDAIARKLAVLGVPYAQGNLIHEAELLTNVLESIEEQESQRHARQMLEL